MQEPQISSLLVACGQCTELFSLDIEYRTENHLISVLKACECHTLFSLRTSFYPLVPIELSHFSVFLTDLGTKNENLSGDSYELAVDLNWRTYTF